MSEVYRRLLRKWSWSAGIRRRRQCGSDARRCFCWRCVTGWRGDVVMIYVIGAGLSGLAAAVWLSGHGIPVQVMEAAPGAGGRCRSYHDGQLGITIDNGNHLILSGNSSAYKFLGTIGAQQNFAGPAEAEFAFHEIPSGKSWTIRPNDGLIPWWIFDQNRRVPDTDPRDYFSFLPLIGSGARTSAKLRHATTCCGGACSGPFCWQR